MYINVCCVSTASVCVHVCRCIHPCEGWKLVPAVFLDYSLPYIETGSLTEPGTCVFGQSCGTAYSYHDDPHFPRAGIIGGLYTCQTSA